MRLRLACLLLAGFALTISCGGGSSPSGPTFVPTPTPAPPFTMDLVGTSPKGGSTILVSSCDDAPGTLCAPGITGAFDVIATAGLAGASVYVEFQQSDGKRCALSITLPKTTLPAGQSTRLYFSETLADLPPDTPQLCTFPFTTTQVAAQLLDSSDAAKLTKSFPLTMTFTNDKSVFSTPTPTPDPGSTPPPVSGCCKVCHAGIACGDSCISAGKTCHQPTGCACNSFDGWRN
jgi:hypothetical protein